MPIRTHRRPTLTRRRPVAPRARLFLASLEGRDVPATFFVTNTLDGLVSNAGDLPFSLRQAIFDANASPGADIIDATAVSGTISMNAKVNTTLAADIVDATVTTCTVIDAIGITPGLVLEIDNEAVQVTAVSGTTLTITRGYFGTTAAPHLLGSLVTSDWLTYDVTGPTTITGPGAGNLTIDALTNSRHFNVTDNAATQIAFSMSGLTLTNGKGFGFGGSLTGFNEDVTLTAVTFLTNSTFGGNNGGGAIAMGDFGSIGKLTVIGCTFDGNSTDFGGPNNSGGAIWAGAGAPIVTGDNDIVIQNSTFKNNAANSRGGAIAMFGNSGGGSSLTISGSTFHDNTAGIAGGALFVIGKMNANGFSITNSTITGNKSGGSGGGVYAGLSNYGTRFVIGNSTIVDNTATSGIGGGMATRSDTNYLFDFENTVISGNKSVNIAPDLSVAKANGSLGVTQLANNSFIGVYDSANGKITGVNNQLGTAALPLNATLAPLANNGGPTQTRRPFGGSPLVDAAAPAPVLATLTANLGMTSTSATVNSTAGLVTGMYLLIESEIVQVSAITSATTFSMGSFFNPLRGLLGTTAAAHNSAATFTIPYTQPANDQRGTGFPRVVNGKVDIGAVEVESDTPTAKLTTPLTVVTSPAQTPYQFNVTFTDDTGLNVATINGNSNVIRVTGPNSFNQLATFVTIVSNTGTTVVVTYQITAPGPNWVGGDNGYYTLSTEPNQVSDLGGKFVEQYPIGTLRVSLPLSLVVNATNDESIDTDGKLSLREAILAANANVFAPDTISFSPAVFATPQTITLTEGELFIGDSLAINGPGAALATIKGVDKRLFTIDTADVKAPVSISNLTLTGGKGESTITLSAGVQGGGAIMNFDEALTIDGCVITGNSAVFLDINNQPNAGSGGGILLNSRQATLTLNNSTISGNVAGSGGGGISLNYGNTSMTITNSVIVNNRAGQFGQGGGIQGTWSTGPGVGGSTITIDNSTIANNFAGSSGGGASIGGGINVIPTKLTVTNSTISGNVTNSSGGGLTIGGSTYLTLRGTTVTGNAARTSAGGVNLPGNISGGYGPNAAIINTIIAGNTNKFTPDVAGGSSTTSFTLPVINSVIGIVDPAVQKFNNINSTFGTLVAPVDALLGPGVYNGGPAGMLTFLPRAGSPALNAGVAVPTVPVATLAAAAAIGDTTIKVDTRAPFLGGTSFEIDGEIVSYKSGGSVTITLNAPLTANHALGAVINRPTQPPAPANDQRGAGFPRQFGTIDIGAVEVNPAMPTAEGAFATVKTAGATSQSLTITFRDDVAINVATLIGNNNAVRVTGPGGFNVLANFVSVDVNTNGTPRAATYSFTPPGGSWGDSDNGLYTVSIEPNQIADTSGNFVFGTAVNTLQVGIARTFVVDVTDDIDDGDVSTGKLSIREAVRLANEDVGVADVITFSPAVFGTPQSIGFINGEIVVTDPVTITGPGSGLLSLDGGSQNRHFNLQMAAGQWNGTVAISGVTLTNGIGKSLPGVGNQGAGGSINNESANLVLDNVVATTNQNGGNSGGFTVLTTIYASMTATNSSFTFNNGFSGGVIFINGGISGLANSCEVTLTNCTFTSNIGTSSGSGGVVNIGTGGTLNVTGSTFSGNSGGTGSSSGGAILVDANGTLNVQSSLFENNFTGNTGSGGAIRLNSSTAVANIQTSSFKTNVAGNPLGTTSGGHGGAIFVASGGKLFLDSSTLSGNTANATNGTGGGGGIYMTGTAQVTVTNSTISGNTSRTMGGGIQLNSLTLNATPSLAGALNIRNSTIAFNSSGIIATTLASAITNSATSMTVVDATGITTGMNLQIDSEIVNVTTVVGNTLTITRAQQGTAAAAHNAAASVYNGGGGGVSFRTTTGTGTPNVTLTSTIVSNNIHVAAPDLRSGTATQAFLTNNSLIRALDGGTLAVGSANNLTGTIATPTDPQLEALALNGGTTENHALKAGSVAINAGSNPFGLAYDQRGAKFNRASGVAADIGAYEVQTVAPPTATVAVNGGGVQRSMVTSIQVTFSEAVTFPDGIAAAFSMVRTGPGGPTGAVNLAFAQLGNIVTITFVAGGAVGIDPANSLIDGRYTFTINAAKVLGAGGTLDGNGNGGSQGSPFDDIVSVVTRNFGDADGDGDVDAQDFGAFRSAFGSNNPTFDFNGDGDVDAQDFGEFRARFGTAV